MHTPDTVPVLFTTSWELWEHIQQHTAVESNTYDRALEYEIIQHLPLPGITGNVMEALLVDHTPAENDLPETPAIHLTEVLRTHNISIEAFMGALFSSMEPFTKMLVDIYKLFEQQGIISTSNAVKIVFDFEGHGLNLEFDVEHFKEVLSRYRRLKQLLTFYEWKEPKLRELLNLFPHNWTYRVKDAGIKKWVDAYVEKGDILTPDIVLPTTDDEALDRNLAQVMRLWKAVVAELLSYSNKRETVKEKTSYWLDNTFQEQPEYRDLKDVYFIASDAWPAFMLQSVAAFIESLDVMPFSARHEAVEKLSQQLSVYFNTLPVTEKEADVLAEELIDILNLPEWKKRYDLYSVWVLTLLYKAMAPLQPGMHHTDGQLLLKFSGTHITTLETADGPLSLWSELRSPLKNPAGKSRENSMQPDYSFCINQGTDHETCVAVIECKQYQKPSRSNFVNAVNDYGKGRTDAAIFLVNYGPVHITSNWTLDYPDRSFIFGNVKPDVPSPHQSANQTAAFTASLQEVLMALHYTQAGTPAITQFIVDISGSMQAHLQNHAFIKEITALTAQAPAAKLLAVDNTIYRSWDHAGDASLKELLALPLRGSTDLAAALKGIDVSGAVIITDEDGRKQLRSNGIRPYLLVMQEADGSIRKIECNTYLQT